MISRRHFLKIGTVAAGAQVAGATGLAQCTPRRDRFSQDSFIFAFVTDVHLRPGLREERLHRCIEMINKADRCDLVLFGGDLIEDGLGTTYETAKSYYDLADSILPELTPPAFHTIGNHDLFGVYVQSGASPTHPEYGKEMYRRRLGDGRTYYSFDHKGWHFISLDSIQIRDRGFIGGIDAAQFDWLREDLSAIGRQRPLCLFTHIPMVSGWVQFRHGIMTTPSPAGFITNNKDLYAALEHYNLRLVLGGHLHVLEEFRYLNARYVNAGALAGGWGTGSLDGPAPSFSLVTVQGEDVTCDYIPVPLT